MEPDKAARESQTSRSEFLSRAVKRYLEEREAKNKLERRKQAAAVMDRFREKYGGWDGTGEVLKWRDRY